MGTAMHALSVWSILRLNKALLAHTPLRVDTLNNFSGVIQAHRYLNIIFR